MTQAAYSIPNQVAAALRADLNNHLLAVVSQNSGATAPAGMFAYQWWADTGVSPPMLRMRNAANSAWIAVCELTAWGLTSVQLQSSTRALTAGTAPAYTAALVPATASVKVVNAEIHTSTTSGPSTLAVNGGTAKGIKQYDGSGLKVDARLVVGMRAAFEDDGTHWILMNPLSGNGATGGTGNYSFYEADKTISASFTIGASAYAPGVTVTLASPAVFTLPSHGFVEGQSIHFSTTGALPTGLAVDTEYFVMAAGLAANTFQVSASIGGAAINTTGIQSGVHAVGKIKNAFSPGPVTGANGVIVTGQNGTTWSGT